MSEPQVFVVLGEQGEYSDRYIWLCKAFTVEVDAQAFVDDLSARVREAKQVADADEGLDYEVHEKRMKAIDPEVSATSIYDVTYYVEAVELG